MCGIAGLWDARLNLSNSQIEQEVFTMTKTLHRRGPDHTGVWCDKKSGVGFGHARLSILDLSPEGHQPKVSGRGQFIITYNGEIYNFLEIKTELEELGIDFFGHSDTEVLLEAIQCWGLNRTLAKCNGMFAFALWDQKEQKLTLVRDRFGQKPLYYGVVNGALIFASELKAIESFSSFKGQIDTSAVTLLLRYGYIPEPNCVWNGLKKLPPGKSISFIKKDLVSLNMPAPETYWSARQVASRAINNPIQEPEKVCIDRLDQLLTKSVSECMVSDVPLGAFLSGGIDSSLVTALMQKCSSKPVRTFSIGFNEAEFNEAAYAGEVARHLGTDHTEFYVSESDALAVIPDLPTLYDEPFADSSQIPTHLVSKQARARVTVALSGDGGDELFCGYNRYLLGQKISAGFQKLPMGGRSVISRLMRSIPVGSWDAMVNLMPQKYRYSQFGDKMHKLATIINANTAQDAYRMLVSLWQDPESAIINGEDKLTLITDKSSWPDLQSFIHEMMLMDTETYLPGDILCKVDRAAMGVSLETRIPLLDHQVFEYAWRLPLEFKIRNGLGKWPLRQVLYNYVPQALIDRPKMGFSVPINRWLRSELRDWAEALLSKKALEDSAIFEEHEIQRKWKEHLSGQRNWQYVLWPVLMYQAWWQEKQR